MESLTNDATMEQIWQSINIFGEIKGYREVGSLQVGEFVLVPCASHQSFGDTPVAA